ncbi:MAG: sigma-70 family RNA polymerase sigma factor [Solirubrobacteraceae bacterium]
MTQLNHADDARLAAAAGAGDEDAFAQLYVRHERPIYNYCLRVTGNETDAADATQDAFAGVFDRLTGDDEPVRNVEGYLYAAARHAALGIAARSRRATPVADVEETAGDWMTREPARPAEDPERAALLAASAEEVRAANAELPMRQREALALREIGELSYDEIARLMGTNANAVAQLLSRARLGLLRELRGASLASFAATSPECARALPLLARRDASTLRGDDATWLEEHLAQCPTCRLSAAALAEVGTSYRAWFPVAPAGLLVATKSAWAAGLAAHGATPTGPRVVAGGAAGGSGAVGAGTVVTPGPAAVKARRTAALLAAATLVALILVTIVAGLSGRDDRGQESAATPPVTTERPWRAAPGAVPTPAPRPPESAKTGYAGDAGASQLDVGP